MTSGPGTRPGAGRGRAARAVLPAVLRVPVHPAAGHPAAGPAHPDRRGARARRAAGRDRVAGDPVGGAAGTARRPGGPARVGRAPGGTHAGTRRGRPRRAGHLVQRDGGQPAGQAPRARGAVQRAAAVRLGRVATSSGRRCRPSRWPPTCSSSPGRNSTRPAAGPSSCCRASWSGSSRSSSTCSRSAGTTRARPRWRPTSSTCAIWCGVRPTTRSSSPSAGAAGSSSGCPRPGASPRWTGAGWNASCATSWSTRSSTARARTWWSPPPSTATRSPSRSGTTAWACGRARSSGSSSGSGGPTRPGPAPPAAPAWAWPSRWRTRGCTAAGCRPGASAGKGSVFRLTLPRVAGPGTRGLAAAARPGRGGDRHRPGRRGPYPSGGARTSHRGRPRVASTAGGAPWPARPAAGPHPAADVRAGRRGRLRGGLRGHAEQRLARHVHRQPAEHRRRTPNFIGPLPAGPQPDVGPAEIVQDS